MSLRPTAGWTWTLAVASLVATLVAWHGAGMASWLVAERAAISSGQLWRLVSGPLVHATWGHLMVDLVVLVCAGLVFEAWLGKHWLLACALGLVVPPIASFASDARLAGFYGTSGLTHALWAAGLARLALYPPAAEPRLRSVAAVAGVLFAGKLGVELATGAAVFGMDLGPNVHQLPVAHASGALAGVLAGTLSAWRAASGRAETGDSPCRDSRSSRAP